MTDSVLSNIKRPVVYENLIDDQPTRTASELTDIFRQLGTDFIFRAFFRWKNITDEDFARLKNIISSIRVQLPNVIIVGGIPAQRIKYDDVDDMTNVTITKDFAYSMALDPMKWHITGPTKQEIQDHPSKYFGVSGIGAYFPDISNVNYQNMVLSWVEKQVKAGVDSIWIDLLYTQVRFIYNLVSKDKNHPAVVDSLNGVNTLVNKIKNLGVKYGRTIYVGSWSPPRWQTGNPLDFITVTVSSCETLCGRPDMEKWSYEKNEIRKAFGSVPVLISIDWGGTLGPMQTFSQVTAVDSQRNIHEKNALQTFAQSFNEIGIKFMHPIHGGDLVSTNKPIYSYGKYNRYDAKAPEFDTYNKIKDIMN